MGSSTSNPGSRQDIYHFPDSCTVFWSNPASWEYPSRPCYKKGAVFPLQKQYQIAASYVRTGSCGAAAAENMCTYNAARKIIDKFMTTGLFEPGGRGSPQTIMQPWKVAYLEALVTYNSFMYLSEIQKALRDKPKLTCSWNSIYPYKLQNSYQFRLNETQVKVLLERFTPQNTARWTAFVQWERTVDPRKLYFVDETTIQLVNEIWTTGRCHTNSNFPVVTNRGDERVKMSVLSVIKATAAGSLEHTLFMEASTEFS